MLGISCALLSCAKSGLVNRPERESSQRKQPRGKLHSIVLRMNRGRKEPERTRGLFSERLGSGVVNENLWYNEEVWELRRKGKCWGSE